MTMSGNDFILLFVLSIVVPVVLDYSFASHDPLVECMSEVTFVAGIENREDLSYDPLIYWTSFKDTLILLVITVTGVFP